MGENKTIRESSAELLRIICILSVLMHHFCIHALYPEIVPLNIIDKGPDSHLILGLYGFVYSIGINCMILISGWFGIKARWKGFVNLYVIYAFYILLASYRHFFSWDTVFHVLLPFSQGHLWFMECYLGLFLVAPILNAAMESMNNKQLGIALLLLGISTQYFGSFWQMSAFDTNGYSIVHFVFVYLIGGFLRRTVTDETRQHYRWHFFGAYVTLALVWGAITILKAYQWRTGFHLQHWNVWGQNNTVLMLKDIAFFLFMMSWHFQNKVVNRFAMSTLGVYMLNDLVVQYDFLRPYSDVYGAWGKLALWIGTTIVFYILAVGVDQIRILITRPLLNKITGISH